LGRFWKEFGAFSAHCVRFILLNRFVYQRVLGRCFSNLLDDSAPALPVIFRSFSDRCSVVIVAWAELRVCASGHWMIVMKNLRVDLSGGIPLLPLEKRPTDNP